MNVSRSFLLVILVCLSACVSQPLPEGFKDKDDFDPVEAAKTRISLGLTYLKNGNYSQAKFNLDKALQFAPRLADAHYSLAYYFQLVEENELADKSYREAIDRAPKNADIANSYGAFLCQQGKYNDAKKYFLKAVNSTNYISTAETYENLALCSQSQGEYEDAITYLENALNHQPSRAKSLLMLVQLQVEQQHWQQAKENLRRYEKNARITPDTLWLSVKIEQALGNADLATGYGDMLVRMYPQHPNTLDYIKNRDDLAALTAKPKKQLKPAFEQTLAQQPAPEPTQPEQRPVEVQNEVLADEAKTTEQPVSAEPALDAKPVVETVENATGSQTASEITEIEEPMQPQSSEEQVGEAETQNDAVIYHVVQKGENLYRISLQYNVKIQRLVEWNQLQDSSAIYVGKKLFVVDPETVE